MAELAEINVTVNLDAALECLVRIRELADGTTLGLSSDERLKSIAFLARKTILEHTKAK